ncbi:MULTISPECIES: hypothetical protein [Actinomyces]|uniref:Uncharacterized protein n=2 Tax=Actinomyces TaxID=1654 RepID=A0A853ELS4_9ACTO|nr:MULTISPECIES: hypothetical protein [Actinomyces]MBF0696858.1 hypothetical protein [Actinomyces bowdenii]NYS69031.1 hypothetical protein [Actinomyces bowdenii]BDA63693.1 hypothetical protein MANAM107_05270 [Actinomyces capricornis]
MGDMISNPRKRALALLRATVEKEMDPMGVEGNFVEIPSGPVVDLTSASGGVNSPDTWTSNLADAQNDAMKAEVGSLANAFLDIISAIDSERSGMEDMVDSESDEGRWPNA